MEIGLKIWKAQQTITHTAACFIAAALILAACSTQATPTPVPPASTAMSSPTKDTTAESTAEAEMPGMDAGTQHVVSLQDNSTATELVISGPTMPAPPTYTPTLTPMPTETRFFPTSSIRQRLTLPPSWTPTSTPTITRTSTPSNTPTQTATPSMTPTRSAADICADFVASVHLEAGRVYVLSDEVDYVLVLGEPEADILFESVNNDTGARESVTLPGGTVYSGKLPLDTLAPTGGTYTWTFSVESPRYDSICAVDFEIVIRQATPLERFFSALSGTLVPAATVEPVVPDETPTAGLLIPSEIQATLNALLSPPESEEE